jgi:hypothetical protein
MYPLRAMKRSRPKANRPLPEASAKPANPMKPPSTGPAVDPPVPEKGLIPLFKREPTLLFTLAYLGVTVIGIWSSYWFYRHFRIPVVEYFQVGDFVVAGLREPVNLLSFTAVMLLMALTYLPTYYEYRHAQQVDRIRKTRWWAPLVFPISSSPFVRRKWYQFSPEAMALSVLLIALATLTVSHARDKARAIVEGGGHRVRVTLSGERLPLQGEARLLGTSNGYVYLYWPENGRTEVLVQESVARIETLPRRIAAIAERNGATGGDTR